MKLLFYIMLFCGIAHSGYSQRCYSYDAGGNRILRQVCVLSLTDNDRDSLAAISIFSPDSLIQSPELNEVNSRGDLTDFVVFPNPATSQFFIRADGFSPNTRIALVDLQGKIHFYGMLTGDAIDISHLPAGSYFLIAKNDSMLRTTKLIKGQ